MNLVKQDDQDYGLVSVLLSLYQPNPSFLRQQLLSLDQQDYSHMEVLIWDDCPGEDVGSLIEACLINKQYHYEKCEANLGYVKAFEYLTRCSTGVYVAFCDQDDIWESHKLTRSIEELEKHRAILATSDRMIIDEQNQVLIPSYRAYSKDPRDRWKTGDDISCQSVFSCYGLGMSLVLVGDALRAMVPFSTHTGHDKWVTMCAATLGKTVYVEEVLQRYRRHGANESGVFAALSTKEEYYRQRVDETYALTEEFLKRFPRHVHRDVIRIFAKARKMRSIPNLIRYRFVEPKIVWFECSLKYMSRWIFSLALRVLGEKTRG